MNADIHTLTGAYAIDALTDEERASFEAHLANCDACRQEAHEFRETAAQLALATAEEPPPGLRDAVLAQIDTIRQEPPNVPSRATSSGGPAPTGTGGRLRDTWIDRLALPAAAAVVLIVVGLAGVIANLNSRLDELERSTTRMVDVLAAPDATTFSVENGEGPHGKVVFSERRGEGMFVASGLTELSEDQVYELWLIGDEGAVPAGLFEADARGRASHVMTGSMDGVQAIGVTVEPAGGSEQPTSDPIIVVPV